MVVEVTVTYTVVIPDDQEIHQDAMTETVEDRFSRDWFIFEPTPGNEIVFQNPSIRLEFIKDEAREH